MPKRYSIADARSSLAAIVSQAEAGSEIELTRRGKPVAIVVSPRYLHRLRGDRPSFSEAFRAFTARHSPAEIGVDKDAFESGRKKIPGRRVDL